ncbi:MAG: discoidin domain-containing protein, partial [Tannerella sp.]|nr:discoidin domain-containing protein [Tannerella sp.]
MVHLKNCITVCILAGSLFACTDMDHTYRDFWKDGELEYPAPVDSVKVFSGKNRIGFEWQILADPGIVSAKMFWNNKNDSIVFPIASNGQSDITRVMLDNLNEATYAFTIYTYDARGNKSIPREATGKAYGSTYENSLLARIVKDAYYENNLLTVVWGDPADATSYGSELTYRTTGNELHTIQVPATADTIRINDYDNEQSGTVEYRTAFVPVPMALDTFYTLPREVRVKGPIRELPRTGWTVTASSWDTRYPADNANPRTPEMVLDGQTGTRWVNGISPVQTDYPHWIALDMKSPAEIYGVVMFGGNVNETPSLIEILTSENGTEWISQGSYSVRKGNEYQYFEFSESQQVRHIKVECKT